jgi:hypothetical protein
VMYGHGKSDEAVVAVNLANTADYPAAERMERRAEAKGNADQYARDGHSAE